ncbi:EH signature domain-containing protein [Vibrio breoganii]
MKPRSWFIEPALPRFTKLSELIGKGQEHQSEQAVGSSFFADKAITSIVEKLKDSGEISELEWLILLRSQSQYESLDDEVRQAVVGEVWNAISKDEQRFAKLTIKLVSGYSRDYISVAKALLNSFPRVLPRNFSRTTKQQIEITRFLISDQFDSGASAILASGKGIVSFFDSLGMEYKGSHISKIACAAENALPQNPSTAQLTWWRSCQDLIEQDQTIEQLERLLNKVSLIASDSPFEKWIKGHCLPDSKNTIWYRLSKESQLKLKSIFNVTDFASVQLLFEKLSETRTDPTLCSREANHLIKRPSFWSDFSDSFGRVRFLLTSRSEKLLKTQIDLAQHRVTVMESMPFNDKSEICILEIGQYILVERFRVSNFDLGIFKKTDELVEILFEADYLDAYTLMKLTPQIVHDHFDWWQIRLTHMLKGLGIHHNANKGQQWLSSDDLERARGAQEKQEFRYTGLPDRTIYFKTGKRF